MGGQRVSVQDGRMLGLLTSAAEMPVRGNERLPVARQVTRGLVRHWEGHDVVAVTDAVREKVFGMGVCQSLVRFPGGHCVPVVRWDEDALRRRVESGTGPLVDRAELRDLSLTGRLDDVPEPLLPIGYITLAPLPQARKVLWRLAGRSPAVAAIPSPPGLDVMEGFECSYAGYTVASVAQDMAVQVEVQGALAGRTEHLYGNDFLNRLRTEQLLDAALVPLR